MQKCSLKKQKKAFDSKVYIYIYINYNYFIKMFYYYNNNNIIIGL